MRDQVVIELDDEGEEIFPEEMSDEDIYMDELTAEETYSLDLMDALGRFDEEEGY
jgi:hypothetical protein